MKDNLPKGIWVKGYEDRMDLFSVMIEGPAMTPYEDGLFFFDLQLPADYPVVCTMSYHVSTIFLLLISTVPTILLLPEFCL